MRLIISEKANTAKKVAQFLAEGSVKEGKHRSVPHHTFTWKGEETMSVGLKGHVLNPEYPEQYSNWQKVEPSELIDAEIQKNVSVKGVANAVQALAKKADKVVIATDFDREGELIGVEALSLVFEANPKLIDHVERARFSALTKGEITRAFDELAEVSRELADAGEARQDIDLIWGATLTRWVSRATRRYGNAFLSVGRVQSPTLALIAERERERRAFVPEPYWEIEANLQNGEPFTVRHAHGRFKEEAAAKTAYENLTDTAMVTEVKQKSATRPAPTPFNTTTFLTTAAGIGISPSRASRLAEDLYTDGYISYPRTDNTVYPRSLDMREVLGYLKGVEGAGDLRGEAAAERKAFADAGQERDDGPSRRSTRPPAPRKRRCGTTSGRSTSSSSGVFWLLCRPRQRAAHHAALRVGLASRSLPVARSSPRRGGSESILTAAARTRSCRRSKRGRKSDCWRPRSSAKRPSRRDATARAGSSRVMEDLRARHEGHAGPTSSRTSTTGATYTPIPLIPTETGIAVAQALKDFASEIASHEMTAELEK